jgi:PAS domain-containing protein
MAVFICPRCAHRVAGAERAEGHQPRGCTACGFGFVFELMDDYYASPLTALICCDGDRRVLVAGHAAQPTTGWPEGEMIGRDVCEALGLRFPDAPDDPVERAREWGVRVLAQPCVFRPYLLDDDREAVVDIFPAYDDDGGLLVALTPETKG